MKIFFTKDDTLYKILKTLEKLPKGKTISILIDNENSFFSHPWWGKQVDSLLKEKNITYVFISKDAKTKRYFDSLDLQYEYTPPNRILHALHMFGLLLFNFKKFHLNVFTKKGTLSYIFIAGELLGIALIIYLMYQFLVPSATILIQPAYTVDDVVYNFRYYPIDTQSGDIPPPVQENNISVPYYMGAMQSTHEISVPIQSVQYLSNPSIGSVDVVNTLTTSFTLKQGTQFVTDDGRTYLADNAFELPPGNRQNPSYTRVKLTAAEKDQAGDLIGDRGNIPSGTRLVIKNLTQSAVVGAVYATTITDFSGGYTKDGGTVNDADLSLLREKLIAAVSGENKSLNVKQEFSRDDQFLLPLPDLISLDNVNVSFNAQSGDTVDILEGKITFVYRYPYVVWQDLLNAVSQYIGQRPSQSRQLISIQKSSAVFYETYFLNNFIVIPTKVSTVWGYDFERDNNHIKEEIRQKVAGLKTDDAKKEMLTYPEISAVMIKTSPAWSYSLPTLKSRIYFRTTSVQ